MCQRVLETIGCLVHALKQQFSVFKQYYTYFHTLFHLHVFSKNTNNVTRTTLPNGPNYARIWQMEIRNRNACITICFYNC